MGGDAAVVAIVLAGGASSRFGSDKLAAGLRGRPVLAHAIERVAQVADRVVLVLPPAAPVPSLPEGTPAPAIARDAVAYGGPLAGLAAGLATLTPAEAEGVAIVVGGDMPSLEPSVLRLLVRTVVGSDATAAARLEADPVATLPLAVRVAPGMATAGTLLAAERRSLRGLCEAIATAVVPAATWRALDPDGRTLADIDTRADLDTVDSP